MNKTGEIGVPTTRPNTDYIDYFSLHEQEIDSDQGIYQAKRSVYDPEGPDVLATARLSLLDFPDEMISEILEWSDHDPTELRIVSRRFHDIVTRNPRLWVIIRSNMSLACQKLALELSREQTLDVELILGTNGRAEKLLLLMKPRHWSRIGRLSISWRSDHNEILNRCWNWLKLERLRYFSASERRPENRSPPKYTFYDEWFAPNLSNLHIRNYLPAPILGMCLRELYIELDVDFAYWPLSRLFLLLAASPSLERLRLQISCSFAVKEATIYKRVELPHVRFVRFSLSTNNRYKLADISWANFVDSLVLPNVEFMHLAGDFWDEEDFRELAVMFTSTSSSRYPKMHTLDFGAKYYHMFPDILPAIFMGLPSLRFLTLELHGKLFSIPNSEDLRAWEEAGLHFPPVESICFRRWQCEETEFFDFFLGWVSRWMKAANADADGSSKGVKLKFVECAQNVRSLVEGWSGSFDIEWED